LILTERGKSEANRGSSARLRRKKFNPRIPAPREKQENRAYKRKMDSDPPETEPRRRDHANEAKRVAQQQKRKLKACEVL